MTGHALRSPQGAPSARIPVSPPPLLIATAAVLAALMVGALTAARVPLGIGLLIGFLYAPLVLINLPLGLSLWVAITFVQNLSAVNVGPTVAGLMVATAWLGTLAGGRRDAIRAVLQEHRKLIAGVVLLLVWLSLSPLWATEPAAAANDLGYWFAALLALLVVSTTIATPRQARLLVGAYAAGAALSVIVGVASGALVSSETALDTAASADGRFVGGGADPNDLAAGLVPAIVLTAALTGQYRNPLTRWLLAVTIALMGFGLVATQSRGGMLAALVAVLAAFVLYRRKLAAVGVTALVVLAASAFFVTTPGAWERISNFDGGGTGRTELWQVGWRIFQDEPVAGVGLDNFRAQSYRYVREPGNLEYVNLIAERPRVVHNVYLELLVETGVIGLTLFLTVIAGCLRAAWSAARSFERVGERRLAEISHSVLVASIALLVAGFFLSNATDFRLWIVLGLGPALFAIARTRSTELALRAGSASGAPR